MNRFGLCALALLMGSCTVAVRDGQFRCGADGSCPPGTMCVGGLCVLSAGLDAGPPEQCTVDAECDDSIDCTNDRCTDGRCVRAPEDAACTEGPDGVCDVVDGCQYSGCSPATCVAGPCQEAHCEDTTCVRTSLCAADQTCCESACTDLTTDPANCNACGTACTAEGGSPSCEAGMCRAMCSQGLGDCDADPTTCETDLSTAENCGGCAMPCGGTTPMCGMMGGTPACVSGCGAGETLCGTSCVDTMTTFLHCGACDAQCDSMHSDSCVGGSCGCGGGAACSGETPGCLAGACVCTPTSCPSGETCTVNGCRISDGERCTNPLECASMACRPYYYDEDGDGFGAAMELFCGLTAPDGFVVPPGDCCDTDDNARPTQFGYFTTPRIGCGGFDYNCDGNDIYEFSVLGACTTSGSCSLSTPYMCALRMGWTGGTPPTCGNSQNFITGCNQAAPCTPCSDPGSCGRTCSTPQSATRTQSCR